MKLCSIASGSSGNCIFAGSERTSLLIDAGISGKRVEMGLNSLDRTAKELDGILITHEHIDHVQGLGVLARRYQIPIYATEGTIHAILECRNLGKFPEGIFHEIREDEPFTLGDTYIVDHLKGLDAVLLEANHDEKMLEVGSYPYPLKRRIAGAKGHLSNTMAGQLLCEILHSNLKEVLLGHLSKENNYEALAYETVAAEVTAGDNPFHSSDFHLSVAKRSEVSPLIEV